MADKETPSEAYARLTKVIKRCDLEIAKEQAYTKRIMAEEHQKAIREGRVQA